MGNWLNCLLKIHCLSNEPRSLKKLLSEKQTKPLNKLPLLAKQLKNLLLPPVKLELKLNLLKLQPHLLDKVQNKMLLLLLKLVLLLPNLVKTQNKLVLPPLLPVKLLNKLVKLPPKLVKPPLPNVKLHNKPVLLLLLLVKLLNKLVLKLVLLVLLQNKLVLLLNKPKLLLMLLLMKLLNDYKKLKLTLLKLNPNLESALDLFGGLTENCMNKRNTCLSAEVELQKNKFSSLPPKK